jgi:hypothetical protein
MFASNEIIKSWVFSPSSLITQGNYLNKSETDVELDILFIASPIKPEIGRTSMFLTPLILLLLSICIGNNKIFDYRIFNFFYSLTT